MVKKCTCGKCAACKKSKTPAFLKGKYTEAKDKKKDAVMLRKAGLTSKEEKKAFEKADEAHGKAKKPRTIAEDKKIDAKIIKGIKKKTGKK
jgi:hypothetical protein